MGPPADITVWLAAWRAGDESALKRIVAAVHKELHAIARRALADESNAPTLQATALVNEAYLRLASYGGIDWQNRAQFFAVASSVVRHILVDHARARLAEKRGAGAVRLSIDDALNYAGTRDLDLIALDDALRSLEALSPRQSRVVELRFFGGLSVEETAEVLKISPNTVKRDWAVARAFLYQQLSAREGSL